MESLAQLGTLVRAAIADWRSLRFADLLFGHRDIALMMLMAAIGIAVATILLRSILRRRSGRTQVALPAMLAWARPSALSFTRHGALIVFLIGLPFFVVALADPYTTLTQQDVTFPGRRIALMIDASSSMMQRFQAKTLNVNGPNDATFFTTVAAAESFVRQRMRGKYRDLVALIEFGDEAYVVTPFTNDYDNILLSMSLIGDWTEFMKFPDQGTTIATAIDQGVALFKAFDFLNASGNLMVIFTDGQDTQVTIHGKPVSEVLAAAVKIKIPVYLIRVSYNRALGGVIPDAIWKPAVESTGGRFYAAAEESTIVQAIKEIDQLSAGKIDVRQYSTARPRFTPYAMMAAGLWALALLMQLTVPYFSKFP